MIYEWDGPRRGPACERQWKVTVLEWCCHTIGIGEFNALALCEDERIIIDGPAALVWGASNRQHWCWCCGHGAMRCHQALLTRVQIYLEGLSHYHRIQLAGTKLHNAMLGWKINLFHQHTKNSVYFQILSLINWFLVKLIVKYVNFGEINLIKFRFSRHNTDNLQF